MNAPLLIPSRAKLVATALASALLMAGPAVALAQTGTTEPTAPAAPSTTPAAPHSHLSHTAHRTAPDVVEQRIASLRRRLHITSSQETAWNAVAQAMRDNAKTLNTLIRERAAKSGTMNAVQDLQSYQQIAQAHVDGLKMLVPAFDTLYQQLSPAQQKTADTLFSGRAHHAAKAHHGG